MEGIVEREEDEEMMVGVDLQTRRYSRRNHRTFASNAATITGDGNGGNFNSGSDGVKAQHFSGYLNEEGAAKVEVEDRVEEEEEEEEDSEEQEERDNDSFAVHGVQNKGPESKNEFSGMETYDISYPLSYTDVGHDELGFMQKDNVTIPKSSDTPIDDEFVENSKRNGSTSFNYPLPGILNEEPNGFNRAFSNEVTKHEEVSVDVQEIPIAELNVERVIEKQETHDLFCPNCNSCITKRVILRRRKRKIQDISLGEEIVDTEVPDNPPEDHEIVSEHASDNRPFLVNEGEDTGREAFRCLSCFSIFIPLGNGLKCWIFGDGKVKENIQKPTQISTPEADQASSDAALTRINDAIRPGINDDEIDTNESPNLDELRPDQNGRASEVQGGLSSHQSNYTGIADAVCTEAQKPQEDIVTLLVQKPPTLAIQTDETNTAENGITTDQGEGLSLVLHLSDGSLVPKKTKPEIEVHTGEQDVNPENEVKIPMPEEPVPPTISAMRPESDGMVSTETGALAALPVDVEADRVHRVDILKAIVYGGLVELITSLSVVTSAVGADATTLNVLALGVANVFGGLFVLAHSLRVLKHETSVERYEQQLGQIGHFPFHATIAILSYLVFGLMPPIVYCFSFRKSNNRDLKLATVASSALLCIVLLAIAKAYVRRPPKSYIKTLIYYVGLGIMVSGASFIVGDLLQLLLEKLGWFQSNYTVIVPVSEGTSTKMKMAWASS
ncbi:hypothetical protein Ancab_010126 [Ancistrocladus abbreviatus]